MDADAVIAALGLQKHPEGGWYREIHRSPAPAGKRAAVTSIYYLLKAGERSHWHRVDADEIWHWHAGAALDLSISHDGKTVITHSLGIALDHGARPQAVVPAGAWQSAMSHGRPGSNSPASRWRRLAGSLAEAFPAIPRRCRLSV